MAVRTLHGPVSLLPWSLREFASETVQQHQEGWEEPRPDFLVGRDAHEMEGKERIFQKPELLRKCIPPKPPCRRVGGLALLAWVRETLLCKRCWSISP